METNLLGTEMWILPPAGIESFAVVTFTPVGRMIAPAARRTLFRRDKLSHFKAHQKRPAFVPPIIFLSFFGNSILCGEYT
jgi:hypothetical protein